MLDENSFEYKYRPNSLDDYVFPDEVSERLIRNWIGMRSKRALLLYGETGRGKSCLGRPIQEELYPNNPDSDHNFRRYTINPRYDIDVQLEAIADDCCQYAEYSGVNRVIQLDEVHNLPVSGQEVLSLLLDHPDANAYFILTTNRFNKLIAALKSRCNKVPIERPNHEGWLLRCKHILESEEVYVPSDEMLSNMIETADGNCRDILQQLDDYVYERKLESTDASSDMKQNPSL